jgi:hypothetical protein
VYVAYSYSYSHSSASPSPVPKAALFTRHSDVFYCAEVRVSNYLETGKEHKEQVNDPLSETWNMAYRKRRGNVTFDKLRASTMSQRQWCGPISAPPDSQSGCNDGT